MKAFGLILVVLGGLVLGLTGFADGPPDQSKQLLGAIVLVIGLIVLASGGRKTMN